ncbi:MAG TPA: FAD-binding oxidoreductase [Vicinamibacteria bacterium]|nr:FAD-binding oxidoreductase [Vicinamibacteria bacterium]
MARPPIEETCFWLASRAATAEPPLEGRSTCDVAIVGAGFTGLWTASFLKELDPALDVCVLEQRIAAYGASGRNAGILGDTIDHTHELAIAHFGRAEAIRLAALGRENVSALRAHLEARGIDCDFEPTGQLHVALSAEQADEFREAAEATRSLGVEDLRLLSRDQMQAEVHSHLYEGGLFNPAGGVLDPVKLVLGLKRDAQERGVRVFENTRVGALEASGPGIVVRSDRGEVVARKAILATNAWSHELLPRLRFRFLPLYDYILVSEPLAGAQREAIGWRQRQGISDARSFFNYYRLTRDDRVLWGTSEAKYYSGNRVEPGHDHSEAHYSELRRSFDRHFPALEGLEFPYAWGGPICATTRFTPFFGSALQGRVHYGLGYTGHGIGTTHLAGRILAHMALGRPTDLLDLKLVREAPFPYPPEPIRTWAVNAVTRALRRVDAGRRPSLLLRMLDWLGIGLSS